ncbi:hypothetical protein [Microvirga flavescens]|uniref:hypothetical protein n=1 Tax=Microvirga flavescens TaxID=2249811 RepID=UPI000DD809FD|nr:hypothetical protein [Microvirga flavescens]
MDDTGTNILAFTHGRKRNASALSENLIETVYAAGSIAVPADDLATKTAAVMLQALGFIVIDAVRTDGTLQHLKRGETREAMQRPWRLSKPAFSGEAGVPDADGAFKKLV